MQLKRMEAYGFKSFADRIAIDFDTGITAIVGPNGSGKSNITDAIRWVLGEQNVRNLRGLRAEDIIFTGSASRKALNLAEVTLIFEHNGELPLEFSEVSIKRRLFRSGDSEYYINNSRCRLKEIYNLFADTGIGHDGMSIIGQNRIDDILGAKPEERRIFFEETAGITKYKNRKRESIKKLEDSEANLVRVNDILHELTEQLAPLAKQAAKTQRHTELASEAKRCHITFLWQKHSQLKTEAAETGAKLREAQDNEAEIAAKVAAAQAEQERLAKEMLELEEKLRQQATHNEEIHGRIEAANVEIATLTERRDNHDDSKKRILTERAELELELKNFAAELTELTAVTQEQRENLALADELLREERQKADEFAAAINTLKEDAARLTEERDTARAALATAEKNLAVQEQSIKTMFGNDDEQEAKVAAAEKDLAERREEQERRQDKLTRTEKEITTLTQSIQETRQEERQIRQELAQHERKLAEMTQIIKGDETRLEMLQRMQESYEGFGKAVKAVLKSNEIWRTGVAGAVAELIKVPSEYVTAIEIALGGNLQNIVTQDTDTAKGAIEFLKRERLGRATFLPLSTLKLKPPPEPAPEAREGLLGYADTLVQTQPKYEVAIRFLLGHTLVVDTLDNALQIAKANDYRLRIVTLAGEFLTPGGAMSGGSRSPKETGYLNREGEIAATLSRLAKAKEDAQAIKDEQEDLSDKLEAAEDKGDELAETRQELILRQTELKTLITGGITEIETAAAALKELIAQIHERQESFAAAQKKRADLAQETARQKKLAEEKAKAAQGANIRLAEHEQDAADLAQYINERELKRAVLEQKLHYSEQNLAERQKERDKVKDNLTKNVAAEAALERDFAQTATRLTALKEICRTQTELYQDGQSEHQRIYETRLQKSAERDVQEKSARDAGQKLTRWQEQKHKLELVASKAQFSLEECEQKLLTDYGLIPERAAEVALDMPPEELKPKLKKLQDELAALGAVNPNAVEEYTALDKRCGFMRQQLDDLTRAKENLLSIIDDMDTTMTRQFSEAFAKIQIYFGEIFVRLFGGGKAELRLLDETDILNTGIEILVQLPQKKQQHLSALSGGERALTVIALLFSFLRYRPSPFSVLDEIDAPLDEANVARFGQFLREFSHNTQFIVVTHRKGTMEAVDTMYGVTIEDAGVSKILSVKIDKQQEQKV